MRAIPLKLGALAAPGHAILRSGIHWLVEDGQFCPANRAIGYINISLEATSTRGGGLPLFAQERELKVVLAPRTSGRISLADETARGGYLNIRTVETWDPETIVATLTSSEWADEGHPSDLRLMLLAGRRMTELADVHGALMPGWHSRTRGWWVEQGERPQTLLSLGVCDAAGVVLGAQCAFLEMFEAAHRSLQLVHVPDHPIAPCAPILNDQLDLTPERFAAIAADVHRHFGVAGNELTPEDWLFLGAMLTELRNAPIKDSYQIISGAGADQLEAPDAVLLSLAVEPQSILRHRTLGYHMHVMRHHQAAAGPAVRAWLASAFEPVRRPLDAIRRDYETLIRELHRRAGTRVIILNRMSTSGHEDISSYLGFDAPLSDTLSYVAAKEWNLMLEDIAATLPLDIVDVDAVAAELGGARHLPDGIHQSGEMQAVLRQEILGIMDSMSAERAPAFT